MNTKDYEPLDMPENVSKFWKWIDRKGGNYTVAKTMGKINGTLVS